MQKSWTEKLGGGSTIAVIATIIISVLFIGILVYSKKDKLSKSEEDLVTYAREIGLDEAKFTQDYKSDTIRDRVEDQRKDALERLDNNPSTPSIFMEGDKILLSAYTDFDVEIQKRLDLREQNGDETALTVEIFFDYNCSACANLEPYTYDAQAKYGEKLILERKHLPFLKESSFMYAYAAEAAREQGKFDEMSRKLFSEIKGVEYNGGL